MPVMRSLFARAGLWVEFGLGSGRWDGLGLGLRGMFTVVMVMFLMRWDSKFSVIARVLNEMAILIKGTNDIGCWNIVSVVYFQRLHDCCGIVWVLYKVPVLI